MSICSDLFPSCKKLDWEQVASWIPDSGTTSISHQINTDYNVAVDNVVIPIVKTDRSFNATWRATAEIPLKYFAAVYDSGVELIYCNTMGSDSYSLSVSENCSIISSTLHYLDQRYGVALYRKVIDTLVMNVASNRFARFQGMFTNTIHNLAIITENDYTATRREEWHLVKDGEDTIVAESYTALHPFGNDKGEGVRQILIFDTPPAQANPLVPLELLSYGFYDYGELGSNLNQLDGGLKDYFYPEWCRNLVADPIWRQAADRRYALTWEGSAPYATPSDYTPPPVAVSPIPVGSFARHPNLSEVYQFLCGSVVVGTDITGQLNTELSKSGLSTHDTTLIYPVSLS